MSNVETFLRAARADDVARCKEMLQEQPDMINRAGAEGYTALHFAAYNGNVRMVEMLLEFKPELNARTAEHATPLAIAAKMKQHDAITKLVECGADVNCSGPTGSAAHIAASLGNTATLKLLVALGAKVDSCESDAGSVLHCACHSGDVDTVGTIVHDFAVDVNVRDVNGLTPLYVACRAGKQEVTQFLLELGADPNLAANDKSLPLHFVAENGGADDVKLLLAFGACPTTKNAQGLSAVDVAKSVDNKASLKELQKAMPSKEKRAEQAARFKAHGNKVFMEGENVKASKFYTLAIANDPTNHVFFSNRSACNFNMRQYQGALYDAKQCIRLNPKWPKGYFRLAATQNALKQYDAAKATVAKGLALDNSNVDLKSLEAELAKK